MNKYIIFLVALSFAKDKVPFGLNLINEKESFLKNSILLNGVQIDVPGQIKNDSNRIKIDSTHLSSIIDSCFGKIKNKNDMYGTAFSITTDTVSINEIPSLIRFNFFVLPNKKICTKSIYINFDVQNKTKFINGFINKFSKVFGNPDESNAKFPFVRWSNLYNSEYTYANIDGRAPAQFEINYGFICDNEFHRQINANKKYPSIEP